MFYKKLRKKGTHPTPLYLKNRILTFGRMILCLRADDVLESGGWYFEGQWMMFWLLLDDISIRKKRKQTLYPLYDWCKLLVFKLLLVDIRSLNPLWTLYRTPYFGAFSLLFFKKMAFIWNKNFHPLERLLPPIGKVASTHWKGCFHPLEARFPDFGSKACRLWTIHSLRMTRQRLSTAIEHVQEALWYVAEPISQPRTTVNTRQNHVCKAYNIK